MGCLLFSQWTKNGTIINKTAGFVDGDQSKYLETLTRYLDSENINYEDFNFEKENKARKDAILEIDFQIVILTI